MSARWVETEEWAAEWFREHGWQFAARRGRGKRGHDLINMPGLHPEIKAVKELDVLKALRQAGDASLAVPFVIERPRGYGREKMGLWPVTFHLRDATTLLRDAGYGTDSKKEEL